VHRTNHSFCVLHSSTDAHKNTNHLTSVVSLSASITAKGYPFKHGPPHFNSAQNHLRDSRRIGCSSSISIHQVCWIQPFQRAAEFAKHDRRPKHLPILGRGGAETKTHKNANSPTPTRMVSTPRPANPPSRSPTKWPSDTSQLTENPTNRPVEV